VNVHKGIFEENQFAGLVGSNSSQRSPSLSDIKSLFPETKNSS
jgi:hypothetical protein